MNFKTILLAGILAVGNSFLPTPAPASEERQVSSMNQCHRRNYRHRHHGYARYYPRHGHSYYHYPRYYYPRRVVRVRWGPLYYEKYN